MDDKQDFSYCPRVGEESRTPNRALKKKLKIQYYMVRTTKTNANNWAFLRAQ